MYFLLGIVVFGLLVIVASARDPIGVGYLLSSDVDRVADARLAENSMFLPPLYIIASFVIGAGAVFELFDRPPFVRWAAGALLATLVLLTLGSMRRRRGTLAVYIRIRRSEIGHRITGDVIEVPKLMFLVMNQPTPVVWLVSGMGFAVIGILLIPAHTWVGGLAFFMSAALLVWLWARNRHDPWELLARRLRWSSLRRGPALTDHLQHALDLDPEVAALRREADAAVARLVLGAFDDDQARSGGGRSDSASM